MRTSFLIRSEIILVHNLIVKRRLLLLLLRNPTIVIRLDLLPDGLMILVNIMNPLVYSHRSLTLENNPNQLQNPSSVIPRNQHYLRHPSEHRPLLIFVKRVITNLLWRAIHRLVFRTETIGTHDSPDQVNLSHMAHKLRVWLDARLARAQVLTKTFVYPDRVKSVLSNWGVIIQENLSVLP